MTTAAKVTTVDMWPVAEAVLPHARRALLYGPPGTGKTYAGIRMAAERKQPLFSVTITEDMSAASLIGHFVPTDTGAFKWHHAPGARAWTAPTGAVLLLNEVNLAGGDLGAALLNLCDDIESAVLTLSSGETIRPHKDTAILATMNGDPTDLSEALQSRFPVSILIDRPHPAAIARLPEDLREAARNTTLADDADRRINLRTWYAFADLRVKCGVEAAAMACFGIRAREVLTGLKIAGA